MTMEFEMLRSFNNNYELLRYIMNIIRNWKTNQIYFNTVFLLFFKRLQLFCWRRKGEGVLECLQ